ncbi:DUF6907 domain-containing protein [Streptomyces scabiei]|uniref:DUF6907 domain-containing protein n=1 Tax=Streptomyces scabiei TaxID=1930 RepID=UPI0007658202|nr:hypothetical protein [Streptomyces scabiei]
MSVASPESAVSVAPRLVPASIGRPGRVQTVWIQCFAWCTVDHVENREVALEDVTHYGPGPFVQVPTLLDDSTAVHEWYVNIMSDPASDDPRMRAAHLVVSAASPEDAHLTEEQGEELAAELIRMGTEIRQALRTCRLANVPAA